ncbi:MAG: hypothetical protein KGL39_11895 [Patescibacteria group bacterium]|nr:hypothetical protein [Patescibacteria group bacterium]
MMTPLALAVAIACAFSQPNCQAIQSVAVVQGPMDSAGFAGEYHPYNRQIIVSDYLNQPAAMSAVLTHEAVNARLIPQGVTVQASEDEAYAEQGEEARWFDATFGAPDFGDTDMSTFANYRNYYQASLWHQSEQLAGVGQSKLLNGSGWCCQRTAK